MFKKTFLYIPFLIITVFCLSGCTGKIADISSISLIYGIITFISLLLVSGYCIIMKKREPWLLILYISVFIVNCGYLVLSVSKTLDAALFANRISYLGSVFLPFSMLLSIMDVCRIKYTKTTPIVLTALGAVVFLIAASPGYLNWYYKDVSIDIINGAAVLNKVYGPLHCLYFIYLIGYFVSMIIIIIYSIIKGKITSGSHATILASAVLGNIAVWGIEQIIDLPFEFLSISYIITELFLLLLFIMLQHYESTISPMPKDVIRSSPATDSNTVSNEKDSVNAENTSFETEPEGYQYFLDNLDTLTAQEKNIYEMYVENKTSKEIMEILVISENTLKTHNKNIYKKLGISSRKQMLEFAKLKRKNI